MKNKNFIYNNLIFIFFLFIFTISLGAEKSEFRYSINLNGEWKLSELIKCKEDIKDDGLMNGYYKESFDDTSWQKIRIPSCLYNYRTEDYSYDAIVWFRKDIIVSKEYSDKIAILHFDAVDYGATVYVNGEKVGEHYGSFTPFDLEITRHLKFGEKNTIAVRCYEPNFTEREQPYRILYVNNPNMGGIYRDVWIEFVPKIYTKKSFITSKVAEDLLNIQLYIHNTFDESKKLRLNLEIQNATNSKEVPVRETNKKIMTADVNKFEFNLNSKTLMKWNLEKPALYYLIVEIIDEDDKTIDIVKYRFGYREFTNKDSYFYLNDKRIFLAGTNIVARQMSANLKKENIEKIIKDMKKKNVVIFRLHYGSGYTDLWYKVADELGMLIYDEFVGPSIVYFDEDTFNNKALLEYKDWIEVHYNYPSIVMWSLSNENSFNTPLLNKAYDLVKSIDKSNRPVCISSGIPWSLATIRTRGGKLLNSWQEYLNKNKSCLISSEILEELLKEQPPAENIPKGDFFDIHLYYGSGGSQPFTFIPNVIEYERLIAEKFISKEESKKPLVAWEWANCAFNNVMFPKDSPYPFNAKFSQDEYVAIVDRISKGTDTGFGEWGLTPLRFLGLRNSILKDWDEESKKTLINNPDWPVIKNRVVPDLLSLVAHKRVCEAFRREGWRLQGVGDLFLPSSEIMQMVYNPVFICPDIYKKNLFAGDELKFTGTLINDTDKKFNDVSILFKIYNTKQEVIFENKKKLGLINSYSRILFEFIHKIPESQPTGDYEIRIYAYEDEKEISDNYYNWFFVLDKKSDIAEIKTTKKVALYDRIEKTKVILNDLRINYNSIDNFDNLNSYDLLVIGYNSFDEVINNSNDIIKQWLKEGGKLLIFEQRRNSPLYSILGATMTGENIEEDPEWSKLYSLDMLGCSSKYDLNTFVDMVLPEHPVFSELSWRNFDAWDGYNGLLTSRLFVPLNRTALATAGEGAGDQALVRYIGMAIVEGKFGKGLYFVSQIEVTNRYKKDSVATKYIKNLLSYLLRLEEIPEHVNSALLPPLVRGDGDKLSVNDAFFVDLTSYTNMGFKDEIRGDGKGGWSDEGENDFRKFPTGVQIFNNIPFKIINPAENNSKSCIILKGTSTPKFSDEIKNIVVNENLEYLYFLHTSAYTQGLVCKYIIHLEDETSVELEMKDGENIVDWYFAKDLPFGRCAYSCINPRRIPVGTTGVTMTKWENPEPNKKIISIDFISGNKKAVPILIAITGKKISRIFQELTDDFNSDELDENKWEEFHQHGKGGEYSIEKDGILLKVPGGVNRYGIRSKKMLKGDFTVETEFETKSKSVESFGLRFSLKDNPEYITFRRFNPDYGEKSFYEIYTLFPGSIYAEQKTKGEIGISGVVKVTRTKKNWSFFINGNKIYEFMEKNTQNVFVYLATYDGGDVKIKYIKTTGGE